MHGQTQIKFKMANLFLYSYRPYWLINVCYYTNICTNNRCKINIKITSTYFGVNTPSSGSLQVVSAKVMNYYNDKIQYSSVSLW